MTAAPQAQGLPLTHSYNLARLGNAGDTVRFDADAGQRGAIARWSGVLALENFAVTVEVRKVGPSRFALAFHLLADVTQSCVVTLEPVPSHMDHRFTRELHFAGPQRHPASESGPDLVLESDAEEGPEEIESLHYDLAAPVLEEYVLSLEPYPRCPGVEFAPKDEPLEPPESPFAVLKSLK